MEEEKKKKEASECKMEEMKIKGYMWKRMWKREWMLERSRARERKGMWQERRSEYWKRELCMWKW